MRWWRERKWFEDRVWNGASQRSSRVGPVAGTLSRRNSRPAPWRQRRGVCEWPRRSAHDPGLRRHMPSSNCSQSDEPGGEGVDLGGARDARRRDAGLALRRDRRCICRRTRSARRLRRPAGCGVARVALRNCACRMPAPGNVDVPAGDSRSAALDPERHAPLRFRRRKPAAEKALL